MEKLFLEDYEVGEVFVTPARTLTETDIVNFAGLTGDWHPMHTDATYAAEGVFGERIAHGFLTLVLGSALIFRLGPYVGLPKSFIAFYGLDDVRFTAPVKIGDTLHLEYEIVAIEDKDETKGLLTATGAIKNQRDELCGTYRWRLLCGKRPAS
jgi:3-hydroxybutyryl-CoA dehydratase